MGSVQEDVERTSQPSNKRLDCITWIYWILQSKRTNRHSSYIYDRQRSRSFYNKHSVSWRSKSNDEHITTLEASCEDESDETDAINEGSAENLYLSLNEKIQVLLMQRSKSKNLRMAHHWKYRNKRHISINYFSILCIMK